MKENNKLVGKKEKRNCTFCGKGWDNWKHFVKECEVTREWFIELGKDEEGRLDRIWDENLGYNKGCVLKKFWKEKEKVMRESKEGRRTRK